VNSSIPVVHMEDWRSSLDGDAGIPRARSRDLPLEWAGGFPAILDSLWLIKKVLPQEGLALLHGHSMAGKTFLALDMAMHVALGWDWHGRRVRKGLVIYVAAEGQFLFRNRVHAFLQHHGVEDGPPFAIIPTPIDLHDPAGDREALALAVRGAVSARGEQPSLIVVDTLSKTLGGGKENTDDLATYLVNCAILAREFGCCVMPVHHRPKDSTSEDPRGHGSLKAGVDTVILVDDQQGQKRARIQKQKDGEEGSLLAFDLHSVDLGTDVDGERVTSCVVRPAEPATAIAANPKTRSIQKLSDKQRIVWDELGRALETAGVAPGAEIPPKRLSAYVAKVVDLTTFADMAKSTLRTGADIKPDTARTTYTRALERLQALKLVGVFGNWIWRDF
jgi:hypothetical protein